MYSVVLRHMFISEILLVMGMQWATRSGLHDSESSKGQIDQYKFRAGRKRLFGPEAYVCSLEEILKRHLIIRSYKPQK